MDMQRYISVYDPASMLKKGVLVIGAGATGSQVALALTKLDLDHLTILDFDRVEPHNISNQVLYGPADIGALKSEALAKKLMALTDKTVSWYDCKVDQRTRLAQHAVFMCVDTMAARKMMFDQIKWNGLTELIIDIRLTARQAMVYAFDPRSALHCREYEATLYDDSEVATEQFGGCAVTTSIGATAGMGANIATWLFMEYAAGNLTTNEVIWLQQGWDMVKRRF